MGDHVMPVDYGFKNGVDLPSWQWLSPFPAGPSYTGTASAYDGSRYIYWVIQYSLAAGPGTTQLWRFCTWTNGWQYLATPAVDGPSLELIYDPIRNVLYATNLTTAWVCFNLNTTSVTIANQACPAWALTVMATAVLPATIAAGGATFILPNELEVTAPISTGAVQTGSTSTNFISTTSQFTPNMVGQAIRLTSGTYSGQRRTITAWTNSTTVTVAPAFGGAPSLNDAYALEMEAGTASAGAATTLTDSTKAWAVNQYAGMDVIIDTGTGNGQRRRIASNTSTVLTIVAAVTGNPRTGNFSPTPDATSVYRILPSSDFLYYLPGTAVSTYYKLDLVQTTGAAWTAALATPPAAWGVGGDAKFMPEAPYSIVHIRGAATAALYWYNIGLNTFGTWTTFVGSETFTTGATFACLRQFRKLFVQKEASNRCYFWDLETGILDAAGYMPYAAPAAYDGHRALYVKTPSGVMWIYLLRAGGQEFFRIPIEWPV
jgi:hypothetical protein